MRITTLTNPNLIFVKDRIYYIYRHLRNDTGTPFYIGRGRIREEATTNKSYYDRAYDANKRTSSWKSIANVSGFTVEILRDELNIEEANSIEKEFVNLYGRSEFGGMLCNRQGGGSGAGFSCSEETKAKLRESHTLPLEEKMLKYKVTEGGCWTWIGSFSGGNPMIHVNGSNKNARRFFYSHFNNLKLRRNDNVHFCCGNPKCVNPNHLELHKAAKAVRDKSPLTEQDVVEIKKSAFGGTTHIDLARRYGVRRPIITKICNGTNWRHVKVDGVPDVIPSEYHKGQTKPVLCLDNGKVYKSAKEAAAELLGNVDDFRYIRKICNSEKYTYCKGYNFRFANG